MSQQNSTQPILQSPPPVAPAPLTLEYQRLDRARRIAIGGLRLLGILFATAGMFLFSLAVYQFVIRRGFRGRMVSYYLLGPLLACGFMLVLGMAKFTCSIFIGRRYRIAAWIALVLITIESLALSLLVCYLFMVMIDDDPLEPMRNRVIRFFMILLTLAGWVGVGYEIIQVLRLEKPRIIS